MSENIDIAIKQFKEIATDNRNEQHYWENRPNPSSNTLEYAQKACKRAEENEQIVALLEELKERREADKWVKITYRPMTKEEEIEYKREFGIDYSDTLLECENKVFTCKLPNHNQDILIQTKWGVKQDTCDWSDGYCGLEENGDWDGVIAWRPTPEYKESEAENES